MVNSIKTGHISSLKIIEAVLKEAEISSYWYRITKPEEDTACISSEGKMIHVYIFERGMRNSESKHRYWYDAVLAFAEFIDTTSADRLKRVAKEVAEIRQTARRKEKIKKILKELNIHEMVKEPPHIEFTYDDLVKAALKKVYGQPKKFTKDKNVKANKKQMEKIYAELLLEKGLGKG